MTGITHADKIILLAELESNFGIVYFCFVGKVETYKISFVTSASKGESTQFFRNREPERITVNCVKKKKEKTREGNKK